MAFENGWGERSETFPKLDLQIYALPIFHFPRIGKDAPVSQGPRTKFHPPLEPTHDVLLGDEFGDQTGKLGFVIRLERNVRPTEVILDFSIRIRRSPEYVGNGFGAWARVTKNRMPREKRRTDGTSSVSRCRKYPHVFKAALRENLRIRDTIERNTAR